MDNERARQIDRILGERRQQADRIANAKLYLESVARLLRDIELQRITVKSHIDAGHLEQLVKIDRMGELTAKLRTRIEGEIAELESLRVRFGRPTLNVGVVGQPRQGKSRLLQSLSGLTSAEIPSAAGLPHTAVRSVIRHEHDAEEAWGLVTFYTKTEFIDEILTPYYDGLNLGNPPTSLEQFRSDPLPELQLGRFREDEEASSAGVTMAASSGRRRVTGQTRAKAEYASLQSIHARVSEFIDLLATDGETSRRIVRDEILSFVAQRDASERNESGVSANGRETFNYLAVRKVEVFCRFPPDHRDVDKVAFIDMPGLGQTVIGDEQRLANMLNDQVDFVLYVKMPPAAGAGWLQSDVDLFDIVQASVPDGFMNEFSLLVLNHNESDGDNLNNCAALAGSLNTSKMHFADIAVANCADPQDVLHRVLDPVLSRISDGVAPIDRQYLDARRVRLRELLGELTEILELGRDAVDTSEPETLMRVEVSRLFTTQLEELALALRNLRAKRKGLAESEDPRYARAFASAVDLCKLDSGMPDADRINRRMAVRGSYTGAYHEVAASMRTRMTLYFAGLDQPLREMTNDCKREVVKILVEQGGLGPISSDRTEQFLTELVLSAPTPLRRFRGVIDALARFELSFWGLVLLQVRNSLRRLDIDDTEFAALGPEPNAETVLQVLEGSRDRTIYEISTNLGEQIESPNRILYAVIDNFNDQLLSDEGKRDLGLFYEHHQSEIWSSTYRGLERRTKDAQSWHTTLDLIEEAASNVQL